MSSKVLVKKKIALITSSLFACNMTFILPVISGTYKSLCPAYKLMEIEQEIMANKKPFEDVSELGDKVRRAQKKCFTPIEVTGTEIISPSVTIPISRVTMWIGGGDSKTRVGTGVTTTILFGPLGLMGFLAKKHEYSYTLNGYDANGEKASIQFNFNKKQTAKRLMAELPLLTGLGMGQRRTIDEIKQLESKERNIRRNVLGKFESNDTIEPLKK